MTVDKDLDKLARTISLRNAVEHNGIAQIDAVISKVIGSKAELRSNVKSLIPEIKLIVNQVNAMGIEGQKLALASIADETPKALNSPKHEVADTLPELKGAIMGKVVTRFPPEPNGYPHIGHAKAAIIDEEYARMYGGKLILRFDDTNPTKEKIEYYDAIKDGLDWLGVKPDLVKNTSDDILLLHSLGKKLVENGGAYVCTCKPEVIRENRSKGIECACRHEPLVSSDRLDKMFNGEYEQNSAIVRFKGNMADQNTAMRDPTLFRIITGSHPRLGDKVKVWPTYDFAAPIEDSVDGVTHAMRTKEYELRNELYFTILDRLSMRKPEMIEFSRLEFEGLPVSKRKLKPLVDEGLVSGWDDPRLPTLAAFRRRGFRPEAIRRFVLSLGITLAETKPPFESLEALNRKIIDPISPRLFFVQDPIAIHVDGLAEGNEITLKNHPNDSSLGTRQVLSSATNYIQHSDARKLKIGDVIRLIELCNVKIQDLSENTIRATVDTDQNISQSMLKIQWVAKSDIVEFSVSIPKTLYVGEQFNPNSLQIASGYAESFASKLGIGSMVQFVRFGFCRLESSKSAILTHR